MEKRLRSPNYPALSLPEAIEKVSALYDKLHNHGAPREVIAKSLGYSGLNGASATAISALHKYGLLERQGDEIRVSERARKILTPLSEEEKMAAVRDAAFDPPLFAELAEKFPGKAPPDDLLKNYLSRKGFAPGALSGVVLAYRQTSDMVGGLGTPYDSGHPTEESDPMSATPQSGPNMHRPAPATFSQPIEKSTKERSLGHYDLEGGGYVRIACSVGLDTETALDMVELMLETVRKELALKAKAANRLTPPGNVEGENKEETSE